jgi:hypothetical protein
MKLSVTKKTASRLPFITAAAKDKRKLSSHVINQMLKKEFGARMTPTTLSDLVKAVRKGEKIEVAIVVRGEYKRKATKQPKSSPVAEMEATMRSDMATRAVVIPQEIFEFQEQLRRPEMGNRGLLVTKDSVQFIDAPLGS